MSLVGAIRTRRPFVSGATHVCAVASSAYSTNNFQVYGVVARSGGQLKREGEDVARCTVARLMRAMGLQGAVRGQTGQDDGSDRSPLVRSTKVETPVPGA